MIREALVVLAIGAGAILFVDMSVLLASDLGAPIAMLTIVAVGILLQMIMASK